MTVKTKVWDWPTRAFHWSLVISVTAAIITGEIGGSLADWHGRAGLMVLGLLVFRLVWGFVGSATARFTHFFPTPTRILAYLRGAWHGIGHNPLGALSVFALLGILAAQVTTGLYANDDIAFEGPLFHLVDKSQSDRLTGLHGRIFWGLVTLIGLHLLSIVFYSRVKRHNLVLPMITGNKQVPKRQAGQFTGFSFAGFVAAAFLSLATVWTVANGLPERLVAAIDANAAGPDEVKIEPEPDLF